MIEKPHLMRNEGVVSIRYKNWNIGCWGEYNEIEIYPSIFTLTPEEFEIIKDFYNQCYFTVNLINQVPQQYSDCLNNDFSGREFDYLFESKLLTDKEKELLHIAFHIRHSSILLMPNITETDPQTNIYLMRDLRTNLIKIGRSNDPFVRESTLQSEQPQIKLIFSWTGLASDETFWHNIFQKSRVRGEWFQLIYENLISIKAVILRDGRGVLFSDDSE